MNELSETELYEQLRKLDVVNNAICEFEGNANLLEKAIGVYFMGHHMGWKWVHLAHSRATINKYEAILNIKFRDEFDDKGDGSGRSKGLGIALKIKDFWQAARGQVAGAKDPTVTKK
ncbi:MAG: hypothetical protein R8M45_02285 [Ghiorsea sp.]